MNCGAQPLQCMPKGEFEVILPLAVFVNALEHQRLEVASHGIGHVDLNATQKDNASWQVVVLRQDLFHEILRGKNNRCKRKAFNKRKCKLLSTYLSDFKNLCREGSLLGVVTAIASTIDACYPLLDFCFQIIHLIVAAVS